MAAPGDIKFHNDAPVTSDDVKCYHGAWAAVSQTAPMVWGCPTTTPSASPVPRSGAEGVPDWRYEPPVRPVGNAIAAVRPPIGAKMPIFCCLVPTAPAPQTFAVPISHGKSAAPSVTGTGRQGVLVAVALRVDK